MSETPEHYNMKIQPIEFIMANGLGFCEGNILKYISRYKQKGGVSDLYKAHYYLELLIDHIEENRDEYKLPTPSEEMAQLEKNKAAIIAQNQEWDEIVKACDKGDGVIIQEVEPKKFVRWNGPRRESIKSDQEIEQLENLKAQKIAENKAWASVVEKDAKEDKTEYEPLQDPNYMQGFNYCETCKTHHLANRDGW